MPHESGLELTRIIKSVFVESVICVLTSYDILEYREAAMRNGADHFMVKGVSTRDEIVGMVQSLLAAEPDLRPADIGLLLPDSFEYAVAVEDAFRLGGLALSGLPVERWRRDLGREAVFHFLYCRQKPAPAMAIAVCLSSPLMPWSTESGAEFAQTVLDGDYELKPPKGATSDARAMLALLREGDSGPESLTAALRSFAALLDAPEALAEALDAVVGGVGDVERAIRGDWDLRHPLVPKIHLGRESVVTGIDNLNAGEANQCAAQEARATV